MVWLGIGEEKEGWPPPAMPLLLLCSSFFYFFSIFFSFLNHKNRPIDQTLQYSITPIFLFFFVIFEKIDGITPVLGI